MKLYLLLGCWGREEENFISCSGISNKILDLTKQSKRNLSIIDYLDSIYKLLDKPLYTNVHTAIFNIQDKFSVKGSPVFGKMEFHRIEGFCQMHNKCGLYLRLKLEEGE